MAMKALLSSLLLLAVTAHEDEGMSPSRQLTWVTESDPVFGSCHTPQGETGCTLRGGFQCSDYLSDGPADADVEIGIGGLPPSIPGEPVHLQFWSPRKSPTDYDPLVSLVECSIYKDMLDAYPRFDAVDFNGGNVRVSETGEATIRVRAPSTYMMWWEGGYYEIPVPHIHLRLCHGSDFTHTPAHAVFFSEGLVTLASTNRPHLELRSIGRYANRAGSTPIDASAPYPIKIVAGVSPGSGADARITSTTEVSPLNRRERGVLIKKAKDALDLDALEFSPVYICLLKGAFFDHFSESCSKECPTNSDVEHGQCVKPETQDEVAELAVTWKLEIDCGEPCWHDKKLVALHHVRLNVAGLLDIPFQEVEVDMGFQSSDSRRLAGTKTAYLTIKVISNRVDAEEGAALLQDFLPTVEFVSQLLGLDVRSAKVVSKPDGLFLSEPVKMDPDNDPYGGAYTVLEPSFSAPPHEGLFDFLPVGALVGIAAGVVVILAVVVGSLVWRRRRAQAAREHQRAEAKVADPEKPNEKVVDPEEPDAVVEPQEENPNHAPADEPIERATL